MSEERSQFAQRINERQFATSRRGYDKREVRNYLEDLEQAFRELEGHSRRTAQRVADLERDLSKSRATEKVSVDNAMMAVFDAKDRILERARRRADEIEEQAHAEASRIKAAAIAGDGGAPAGELEAARAQADEIVAAARREADRLRQETDGKGTEELEAELAATAAQLRRAHDDTSAARKELDAARKRIVELENGTSEPSHLEEKFAELENHLSAARADVTRLEGELTARDDQISKLEDAVAAAETALEQGQARVAAADADAEHRSAKIADLEAELERARAEAPAEDEYLARLRETEALLRSARDHGEQDELVGELTKASAVATESADRSAELESDLAATREELAGARETIADLRAELAAGAAEANSSEEATALLEAAREEAREIRADAEEEAEQRAAKVIAKAREEAEQVRETVATLTAQAEEARSVALRSKLEAEDLVEAQRSMSQARDDIIAAAESRAEEIETEASRAAASMREEAETRLADARTAADRLLREAEQKSTSLIAAAEARTEETTAGSDATPAEVDTEDELEAMLAAAEQDVGMSEELRLRRAELDQAERELAERERALAAQQEEAINPTNPVPADEAGDAKASSVDEAESSLDDDDDDDDPAERLSALLEQVSPTIVPADENPTEHGLAATNGEDEAKPRMAWPTPGAGGQSS